MQLLASPTPTPVHVVTIRTMERRLPLRHVMRLVVATPPRRAVPHIPRRLLSLTRLALRPKSRQVLLLTMLAASQMDLLASCRHILLKTVA